MQFRSIRFKTNVLYTVVLFFILILYSGALFYTVHEILYDDVDDKLKIKAHEVAQVIDAYEQLDTNQPGPLSTLEKVLNNFDLSVVESGRMIIDDMWRADVEVLNLKRDYIRVLNAKGQAVLYTKNFSEDIANLFETKLTFSNKKQYFSEFRDPHRRLRVINYPYKFKKTVPIIIQIATPLDTVSVILNKVAAFIGIGLFLILAVSSFLGGFFVKRVLKPVMAVTNAANHISFKDLSDRIQPYEMDIEMKHLIDSFNTMLDRLEKSFNHISEFSSYVAHELKTPLAIARGELELALEQERDEKEYKRVIEDCLEEIDRMIRIVRDLLLLAKLDYKPEIFQFEKIDFNDFMNEIYEQSKILASPKGIEVQYNGLHGKHFVNGDKVHLRRLFLNIINNAVKFTSENGMINLSLETDDHQVYIKIQDNGEGIAKEHLTKIFDKFYRIHKETTKYDSGSGLGLSIALSITKAHRGDINVESELQKGTVFTIILPTV